jgi:hypothetical protein
MSLQKINTRSVVLVLMIVAAAAMRLVVYQLSLTYPYEMSNFTPFGAIALFGGAYFTDKWKAYLIVLIALFLSNIPINFFYTSKVIFFTVSSIPMYFIFALMVLIGTLIRKATVVNIGIFSLICVALHWLLSDLPWLYGTMYPHTLSGYGQSLVAAIPFERNMIIADIVFCTILFGGFELAKNRYAILRSKKEWAV